MPPDSPNPSPTQEVEAQRFLWEADQLAYEPRGTGPKVHGAELLAPPGEYLRLEDHQRLLQAARKQGEDEAETRLYAFFDDDEYPEAQLRFRLGTQTIRAEHAEAKLQAEVEKREEVELRVEVLRDQLDEAADRASTIEDLVALLQGDGSSPKAREAVIHDLEEIADTLSKLPQRAITDYDEIEAVLDAAEKAAADRRAAESKLSSVAEAEAELERRRDSAEASTHAPRLQGVDGAQERGLRACRAKVLDEALQLLRDKAACPSCGSPDRFVLREPCAIDSHEPNAWHRGTEQAGRQEDVLETVEEVGAALESGEEHVDKAGTEDGGVERECPDGGACHHGCGETQCWRVHHCEPLSGYGENWTSGDREQFGCPQEGHLHFHG